MCWAITVLSHLTSLESLDYLPEQTTIYHLVSVVALHFDYINGNKFNLTTAGFDVLTNSQTKQENVGDQ